MQQYETSKAVNQRLSTLRWMFCEDALRPQVSSSSTKTAKALAFGCGRLQLPDMSIDRDKVLEFAARFRKAMEQVNLEAMAIGFRMFPRGACSDTSLLLGTALREHGLGDFRYVCASKSEGGSFESHAWLRAEGLIVDITADQFEGMPPVFVGEDDGWYQRWGDVTDLGDGDYRQCTGGYSAELEGSYRLVMAKLS